MGKQTMEAKVYSSTNRLTVVAPMPGLSADQIEVSLQGELLTIETTARSPERCGCRVALPRAINGTAATAVYAYGVLVVSMPLANPGGPALDELGPGLVKRDCPRTASARVERTGQGI